MAGIDVFVGKAEALGAEDEGDPLRRRVASVANSSRGARFGGPKSRGVIAVAQT